MLKFKWLLANKSEEKRFTALLETLEYGQQGLELLIKQSLNDKSDKIKQSAYWILHSSNPYLNNFTEVQKLCPTDTITCLAMSSDNKFLVGGSWQKIFVWDLQTGKVIYSLEGSAHWVLSVAISPDGNTLVSGSADKTIKIWDLKTGQLIRTLNKHNSWVNTVAISPDGNTLVSGSADKTIKTWELSTGQLKNDIKKEELGLILSLVISPDGRVIASGSTNNNIYLWNLENGNLLRTLEGHSDWITSIAITSDSQTLISGSRDGTIKFWQSDYVPKSESITSQKIGLKGLLDVGATTLCYSGAWYIGVPMFLLNTLVLPKNSLSLLPIESLKCVKNYQNNQKINSLICSQDKNLVITNYQKGIKVFSFAENIIIHTLSGQSGFISSVAISSNGKITASAGSDWVILWDVQTSKPLHPLEGCSYPRLSKISISKSCKEFLYKQSHQFTVTGLDQNDKEINLKDKDIKWEATGGKIEQGLFTAGQHEGKFKIKVKVDIFEASVPITVIEPPKITQLHITPSTITLEFGKTQKFIGKVLDQRGNQMMQETVSWQINGGGKIDKNGNFIAGYNQGKFEIIASVGAIKEVISVTVLEPPRLDKLIIDSSIDKLDFGQSFQFEVKGLDQYGNYIKAGIITWSTNGGQIDKNGNFIAGYNSGDFEIIASVGAIKEVISVTVLEPPRLDRLIISSSTDKLDFGQSFQFEVKGLDQYGNSIKTGMVTWSANSGIINNTGIFHASNKEEIVIVRATVGTISTYIEIEICEPSRLTRIEVSPSSVILEPGKEQIFSIVAFNQRGEEISVTDIHWNATDGIINESGYFRTKDNQKGYCTVTATVGHLMSKAEVFVPAILKNIKISPKQIELKPEKEHTFTAIGFDQTGEHIEIKNIQWKATTGGFINSKGVFQGNYKKREVLINARVGDIYDTAQVILVPVLRRLEIYPSFVYLKSGEKQLFTVKGFDQFNEEIDPGKVYWKTTGGKITQDGTFTTTPNIQGYFQVTVKSKLTPKHTKNLREILFLVGIFSRLLSWFISYEKQLKEIFALILGIEESEIELVLEPDTTQNTDTVVQIEKDLETATEPGIEPDTNIDISDFEVALQRWFAHKLQNLIARFLMFISRFCLNEATANLSASADVFVLAVEYNPYKYFDCLYTIDYPNWHNSFAITPDGKKFIFGNGNNIDILDLNTGKLLNSLKDNLNYVSSIAITPDGKKIISGGDDGNVNIWNLEAGELTSSLKICSNPVLKITISPDGKKFITWNRELETNVWNLETLNLIRKLEDLSHYYSYNTNFTADSNGIVIARKDIEISDIETGNLLKIIKSNSYIYSTAITKDGNKLVTRCDGQIKVWNLKTGIGKILTKFENISTYRRQTLAITSDGHRVVSVSSDKTIKILDLKTGEILHSIEYSSLYEDDCYYNVYDLVVNPNGRHIISSHSDGKIRIWGIPELNNL